MPAPLRSREGEYIDALQTLQDHPGYRLLQARWLEMLNATRDSLEMESERAVGRLQGCAGVIRVVMKLRESMIEEFREQMESPEQ